MNIFKEKQSFLGQLDEKLIKENSISELFQDARHIKDKLGNQGYLLDCYLASIFEGLSETLAFEVAHEGFEAAQELTALFTDLLDCSDSDKTHPLYQKAQEIFQQSDALNYQERYTKICLLSFHLADELIIQSSKQFTHRSEREVGAAIDMIREAQLFDQISGLVGERAMEELNKKIKQRFIITPLAQVYAQAFNNNLLFMLTSRDCETSKQIFQLLIDTEKK